MKQKPNKRTIEKEKLRLSELVETVYQHFTRSLNVNIAFMKVGVDEKDKQTLLNDTLFIRRINLYTVEIQEELIQDLRELKGTLNEGLKFQVITRLGKMIYPEKFKENVEGEETIPITPDRIILKGSDE